MDNTEIPDAEYHGPIAGQYTTAEHLAAQQNQTDPRTGKPLHEVDVAPAEAPAPIDTSTGDPAGIVGDPAGDQGGEDQGQHTADEQS